MSEPFTLVDFTVTCHFDLASTSVRLSEANCGMGSVFRLPAVPRPKRAARRFPPRR
jgi:hypothetical protein